MKFSISNIAWDLPFDDEIIKLLKSKRIEGIEVAPTKIWPHWENINLLTLKKVKEWFFNYQFQVPALQAILYGLDHLNIFDRDINIKNKLLDHFKLVSEIANHLNAKFLIFGAPKNRDRKELSFSEALKVGVEVFNHLADICKTNDTILLIEPNPINYSCNFITNSVEAIELIKAVNHPSFRLHLDIAAMTIAENDIEKSIKDSIHYLCHFHVSELNLSNFNSPTSKHQEAAKALKENNYNNWISIEMKCDKNPQHSIHQAINFVREIYFEGD